MLSSIALQLAYLLYFQAMYLISEMTNMEWARTLVSLSEMDITWYRNKLNVEEIIFNCGRFPNVPLIESKVCIKYNLMLAL